jgi:hypothetical protein
MRDEIDGRIWSAHHDRLSADLHALFVKIGDTLARLHRIHWSAPWRGKGAAERRHRTGHA